MQPDIKGPLGYITAVPICYCNPGTSAQLKKRIEDLELDFKKIHFIIDRYIVSKSKVTPTTLTGDGSTLSFLLDEIVHEEDILVKQNSTISVFDTDFKLTHDVPAQKTTVIFTSAPTDGTIIRVERANDKYLKFKDVT